MQAVISGLGFIEWLIKQGVIADGRIRRVIIDATFDRAVKVYVEQHGTTGLIGEVPAELLGVVADYFVTPPSPDIEERRKQLQEATLRSPPWPSSNPLSPGVGRGCGMPAGTCAAS